MPLLLLFLLFLAMTNQSSATYCLCKDGVGDPALQKNIDYACGTGADCTPIIQNGACYQPNTVKSHCDYAVNSYFQRKNQIPGSCDFSGTATVSANPPTNVVTGCAFPTSNTGGTTTTTPTTPTTTPSTTTGGTTTGTTTPSVFPGSSPLGPTGIGDQSGAVAIFKATSFFFSFGLTLWFSGLVALWG